MSQYLPSRMTEEETTSIGAGAAHLAPYAGALGFSHVQESPHP